jgi:transcriptional regulator with XRE-family HTH domain
MSQESDFATLLCDYMDRKGFTSDRLSRRSDVPKSTIENWRRGTVSKPQQWQPIVQIARVLELNREEVDELLDAAGHPTVSILLQMDLIQEDQDLLRYWETELPPDIPPLEVNP